MILEYEDRTPHVGDTLWTIIRDNSGVPTGMMECKILRISFNYRFLTVIPPAFYATALDKDVESTLKLFNVIGAVFSGEKTDHSFDKILETERSDYVPFPYTETPTCDCFFSREECENALNNDAFRKGIIPGSEIWVVVRNDSDHPEFVRKYYVLSANSGIVFAMGQYHLYITFPRSKNPFSLDACVQDMLDNSHFGKDVHGICVFRVSDCYKSEDDAWRNLEIEQERSKRCETDGDR